VIATARPAKHEYVKKLGADLVLDYSKDISSEVKAYTGGGVDVVFDCVGGEAFTQGLACMKRGSRIVSILEHMDEKQAAENGVTASYVFVHPSGKDLQSIAILIEQKKVVPPRVEEMALKDAAIAQEKLRAGNVFGKIVLKVS
jgi:NADPH:quinone reductase-like Zn-dependent oxidoreductase